MSPDGGVEIFIDRMSEMCCAQCGTRMDISGLEPFTGIECPECGNQDAVPARFGQFLLLNLINTGGMGGVYRARDESLGRLVAIKVMLQKLGADAEFVENFKREAQAAARLNHPHVAQIYSYGQVQGQPYIVMELVSGHRFDRLIESHPEGLEPALVLPIAIDIAEGLQAADEIGLVHGDIKPENILLDEKRQAKLVDFGIASFADQAVSEGIWGTPYYIAPERARGRKSDARSDIYSLGATLYHALAGKPPFEGETPIDVVKARLTKSPPPLDEVRPGLPKALAVTIGRMLEREPAQRHPTYASLIGDLRRNLQEVKVAVPSLRAGAAGKRVILKRKDTSASARVHVTGSGRSGPGIGQIPRVEEQRAIQRARRLRAAKLTALIVSVLAILVVGSIWLGARHAQAERDLEARRVAYALTQSIAHVQTLGDTLTPLAATITTRLADFDSLTARAHALVKTAEELAGPEPAASGASGSNAVVSATGEAQDVWLQIRGMRDAAAKVDALALATRGAVAELTNTVQAIAGVMAGLSALTNATDVADAETRLQGHKSDLEAFAAKPEAPLAQAGTLLQKLDDALQNVRAELERERQNEEQRRVAKEQADLIASEVAAVTHASAGCHELVTGYRFKDALREVADVGLTLKTDEGKAALAAITNRYSRLVALKAFLIDGLNRAPYPWGWVRPGGSREDVLGADERSVRLREGSVPWERVSNAQFLAFVEHYARAADTKLSVQGDQYLATAVYLRELGNAEAARKYRDKAVATTPSLRDDAKALVPLE